MINKKYQLIKVDAQEPKDINISHNRLTFVIIAFTIAFTVIAFRLFDVAILSGRVTLAQGLDIEEEPKYFSRRQIVDRNGVLLAINLATASLYANPKKIIDVGEVVDKLQRVFPEMDKEELKAKLYKQDRSFVWIKRNLTPNMQYKVNALGIPGLEFMDEERRVYPQSNLFAHVLGYTDIDGAGLAGIEKYYDDAIRYNRNFAADYDNTENLVLSLDIRVQEILRSALLERVEKHKAKGASGVVMDVSSGEIMAMVSLPDFNPHSPGDATKEQLFNKATFGVYEMGSTFKTFTMAMGLESAIITMQDNFDVSKPLQVANFTIRDFHQRQGMLSIPEIYIYSSNIGSAKIAQMVGDRVQRDFFRNLGLFDTVEIDFYEVAHPIYPTRWGKIRTMTTSYGHGIAVTPLHMVRATSALVNGGRLQSLSLLKKPYPEVERQVVSVGTSEKIRQLMRLAVKYGTGKNADVKGYMVGGKTGSADKAFAGGYDEGKTVSSFVGAFPINDPKYVIFAMIDEPAPVYVTGLGTTGGATAAPVVREVISAIAPILGVMPVYEENIDKHEHIKYSAVML